MSNYTPTPWLVDEGVEGFPDIVSEDFGEIVGSEGFYSDIDRDYANARHTVKCVNYHDRLVGALTMFVESSAQTMLPVECERAEALLAELSAHNGGEG